MSVRSTLLRHPGTALPAIALTGLVLAAAGCGGDDSSSSDSGGSGGSSAPSKDKSASGGDGGATVSQVATDFKFSKPSATAKAGNVTVTLGNKGQAPHAIEIEKTPKGDVESTTIQPGESTSLKANLPAGSYEFYCPVANHKELGMKGELTVK